MINPFYSPSSADISAKNVSETTAIEKLDNSESPENEIGVQNQFSLSTSVAVNSDLSSPEGHTVNFTSITSKESPINSTSLLTNGENPENAEKLSMRTNSVVSAAHNVQDVTWNHG